MPFSPWLICILLVITIVSRLCSTVGFIALLKLCGYEKKHPNPINFRELFFIWYAGLIRGAIAFGLVLRIDKSYAGRDLVVTTCLSLVLISTIFFGSTVGLVSSCLFSQKKKKEAATEIEAEELSEELEPNA